MVCGVFWLTQADDRVCVLFCSGNLTPRIVYSILVEVIVFIVTVVMAMMDSSEWPGEFFWLTMSLVVVLNGKCGLYIQNEKKLF